MASESHVGGAWLFPKKAIFRQASIFDTASTQARGDTRALNPETRHERTNPVSGCRANLAIAQPAQTPASRRPSLRSMRMNAQAVPFKGNADIGRLLDDGAYTTMQKVVVFLAAMSIVMDGFDGQLIGFAIPLMIKEWGITRGAFAPA